MIVEYEDCLKYGGWEGKIKGFVNPQIPGFSTLDTQRLIQCLVGQPNYSESELVQSVVIAVARLESFLKQPNDKCIGGSVWNQMTATRVSEKKELHIELVSDALSKPGSNLIKDYQRNESELLYSELKNWLIPSSNVIAAKERLCSRIESWKTKVKKSGCSSEEACQVAGCICELQLNQPNLPIVNIDILPGVLGQGCEGRGEVNLIAFHCLPHINCKSEIKVFPKLKFETKTSTGRAVKVDKLKEIYEVVKIHQILSKYNIKHKTEIVLMDCDAYILDSQNIEVDCLKYKKLLVSTLSSLGIEASVVSMSQRLGLKSVGDILNLPEIIDIRKNITSLVGSKRMIDIVTKIKEKLLLKNIDLNLFDIDFAKEVSERLVAIDLFLGQVIPDGKSIIIERSTTKEVATQYLLGSRKLGLQPTPFLFYWNTQVE